MITETIAAVVGAGASQTFSYGFRQYKKKTVDVNQWYEDVISTLSYGLCICQSARERSNLKYGDIAEESKKVTQRLKGHLNPHPKQVSEESVFVVKKLEELFRKLSAASEATDEQSALDSIEELFEMAQRESDKNSDLNMGKVFDTSADYSPIMKGLFDKTEKNPQKFGSKIEDQINSVDSFNELIQTINTEDGFIQKPIENMVEAQYVTEEWDESLSVGIRVLLQVTSNLCEEAINNLSESNNMNSTT